MKKFSAVKRFWNYQRNLPCRARAELSDGPELSDSGRPVVIGSSINMDTLYLGFHCMTDIWNKM